jgi:hypothetical protein
MMGIQLMVYELVRAELQTLRKAREATHAEQLQMQIHAAAAGSGTLAGGCSAPVLAGS